MMNIGSNKLIKVVIISILMTSINSTNSYAAGRSTTLPANTVLSGRGVPSATIGLDGDFYIDTKSLNIYGPKTKSKWPIPVSLKGPSGPIGPAGVDGKNGATGLSTSSSGAPGPAGAVGPAGSQGAQGNAGATGATGPAGSGSGSAGPAGPKGETGTVGVVGPSNVYFGSIPFVGTLSADPGNSKLSSAFGDFVDGKKYFIDVMIRGSDGDPNISPMSLTITSSAGTPTISVSYLAVEGHSYRGNTDTVEHSLIAKVIVDATSAGANFSLFASVKCGNRTTGAPMTFNGDYFAILVGSIN
jgi:hypothetical protein